MAQKAPLPNKLILFAIVCCSLIVAISNGKHSLLAKANPSLLAKDYTVDTAKIPHDTLSVSDSKLSVTNGVYFLDNKKYSGIIKEAYPTGIVKSYRSIFQGQLHGLYKSFYENGQPFEVRQYKNNLSTGRHYGYWSEGGKLKFDYNYFEEKREGLQKKWYKSGRPYLFANFSDDHEDGLQQGWRENGKLFLNYVAKDGHTYGLQQTALCYTLLNEKIKSR